MFLPREKRFTFLVFSLGWMDGRMDGKDRGRERKKRGRTVERKEQRRKEENQERRQEGREGGEGILLGNTEEEISRKKDKIKTRTIGFG